MSALGADKNYRTDMPLGVVANAPAVKASQVIYEGALVSENTGAVPHSGTLKIYGVAQAAVTTGSSVTSYDAVAVLSNQIIEITVGGSPVLNALVYCATDNADDATTTSSGASIVGKIVGKGIYTTTKWRVLVAPWLS